MKKKGIYRFYHKDSLRCFVGFSYDLRSTKKRLLFELKMNACSFAPLQSFYNDMGELSYEVLHVYVPMENESEIETEAHLRALLIKYIKVFKAEPVQVQV